MSNYSAQQIMLENQSKIREWTSTLHAYEFLDKPVVYAGNVTGLSHYQYNHCVDNIKVGTPVTILADPNNRYDPNALAVHVRDTTGDLRPIGWIPKALNMVAAEARRQGYIISATVIRHRPDRDNFQQKLIIEVFIDKGVDRTLTDSDPYPEDRCLPNYVPIHQSNIKDEPIMAIKSVNAIVEQNISLGTSAAFLEAGRIANNQLSAIAGKKLPIMLRGYADTALGRLLLANIALMARDHFRPNDERLGKLVKAMAVSAYQEVLQNFDIEAMIDDMISNSTIKRALSKFDAEPEVEAAPKASKK
jgi:hypothetical protein